MSSTSPPTAPGITQYVPLPYGHARHSRRDPLGFLSKSREQFGDIFRYQVGPWVFHLISHPDGVRHVLQDNYRNYPRSRHYKFTRLVIGDGLVATEGDRWRRDRRMMQPAFHEARVAALGDAITRTSGEMLERWEASFVATGRTFDVLQEMMRLTLEIVGRALMGVELTGEVDAIRPAVAEALAYLEYRINDFLALPLFVPTPRNLRFRAAMRTMDRIVYQIIAERRKGDTSGIDLLSLLLAVRDEETGAGMTDRELRDQVMTFIGAGHETTAVALGWFWYLMTQHPEIEDQIRREIDDIVGERVPTAADVQRLPLTRAAFLETMRLYPPVYAVVRDVVADDVIGGFSIPARTCVILSQYVTHHHPGVWSEPSRFDPSRFLPDRSNGRAKFAFFPFLGGPHHCIGADFAVMEAVLVIAMTLQRYRLELAPGARVELLPVLTMRPRYGVPVVARRA